MPKIKALIKEGEYEEILAAVQSPVITLTELIKNSSDSCLNNEHPIIIKINTDKNEIIIEDSGVGFSEDDLKNLGVAGFSKKMQDDEQESLIGIPYAGNKGLGILTAFFLAKTVIIETNSYYDKKSYFVEWHRGNQEYIYSEVEKVEKGTVITLKDVDDEKMKMILLPEEKVKIFLASIRFYTNNTRLPKIRLFVDGTEESYYPKLTFEEFYSKYKGNASGFIARASFKYKDNILTLSYEDNISNFYNFQNQEINLNDLNTLDTFISEISAPTILGELLRKSELLKDPYLSINLSEFSGCFYTWRYTKIEELEEWPVGVRIYINNYSLYRYMDQENDWLTLSSISQNVKATNYKLKNTYGYVDFNDFNENNSQLKISKERNDFVDSLAQRKFIKLMREMIITIFTRIDMAVKNPPRESIALKESKKVCKVGQDIDLKKLITCNFVGLDQITITYDKSKLKVDSDWILKARGVGSYNIGFIYKEFNLNVELLVKKSIPSFRLEKEKISISEGNSINLREFIVERSCIDVNINDIKITARNIKSKLIDDLFSKDNNVGIHSIQYTYEDIQKILTIDVKKIEVYPGSGKESQRIINLFPRVEELSSKEQKITELIKGILSYYAASPTLCMAGIRILLESASKAFFQSLVNEEIDVSFEGLVNKVLNISDCNVASPDFSKYVLAKGEEFGEEFVKISESYSVKLSKDVKKSIKLHLSQIDLNMFIHNPRITTTDTTVFGTMLVFEPLLNYIFDILLI